MLGDLAEQVAGTLRDLDARRSKLNFTAAAFTGAAVGEDMAVAEVKVQIFPSALALQDLARSPSTSVLPLPSTTLKFRQPLIGWISRGPAVVGDGHRRIEGVRIA